MTTASAQPAGAKPQPSSWRIIAAASIGNALEWFDLVVYGFFAVTIARLFFPSDNESVSLLLTLGTFGVSFFMRPLGALVLGVYADRVGRRATLTLAIMLMMLGTLIIAIMPTYDAIGIWAPIGIVVPEDYTLVISRVAVIPGTAPRPQLAAQFIDYLLSPRGQEVVADRSALYAISSGIKREASASGLRSSTAAPLHPIALSPALLVFLDRLKRERFLQQWQSAILLP